MSTKNSRNNQSTKATVVETAPTTEKAKDRNATVVFHPEEGTVTITLAIGDPGTHKVSASGKSIVAATLGGNFDASTLGEGWEIEANLWRVATEGEIVALRDSKMGGSLLERRERQARLAQEKADRAIERAAAAEARAQTLLEKLNATKSA